MSKNPPSTSLALVAESGCSRREALRVASGVTAGALLSGCGAPDELGNGVCMAGKSTTNVVASGAEMLAEGSALRVMGAKKPIYVARDERGFMAVNATCSHEHCETIYVASRSGYECGCHGARYAIDGTVLMGPAQKPLTHVFICRNGDGMLVVQPDHPLQGNDGRIV